MPGLWIRSVKLKNFKAFREYSIRFDEGTNIIVGPNNAGKTTALRALRAVARMLTLAGSRKPTQRSPHRNGWYPAFPLSASRLDLKEENLRHEFSQEETSLTAVFSNGSQLRAIWAFDSDGEPDEPFFYLLTKKGRDLASPTGPKEVREAFPKIGLIPPVFPVRSREKFREPAYVRKNSTGRLSSLHFRNQLEMLRTGQWGQGMDWDEFLAFANPHLPGITISHVQRRTDDRELDVYYKEGRFPKELDWAGDGIQTFLQILFHLYRHRHKDSILLDEPDLYLHADLQTKVVDVAKALGGQVIVATHSSEILADADPRSVIWVDKGKGKRSITAPDEVALDELSLRMGTRFNLRLAKVLVAKVALFVEGDDDVVLKALSGHLGFSPLSGSRDVAIVPIGGFSNWRRLKGFSWLAKDFLQGAVKGFVLLDRDFHSPQEISRIGSELKEAGLETHVWQRKALESYLLHPDSIARATGAESPWVVDVLRRESEALKKTVLSNLISAWNKERADRKLDMATVADQCQDFLELEWVKKGRGVEMCDPKELIHRLNAELQVLGHRTCSPLTLALNHEKSEIPAEMISVLRRIDHLINS